MMPLLDSQDAARLLGMSVRNMERLRADRRGPRFIRLGKLVRFREADIEAYIEAQADTRPVGFGNSVPAL
jgi:excisionase family DNA binding protein